MPNCDLCGRGRPYLKRAKIEGAVLDVCDFCAGKGEVIRMPAREMMSAQKPFVRERDAVVEDVVSGFGRIVREARESREWEVKKLAEMLHAKESLMHKIEKEKIKPDLEFARKIGHVLGVHLVERVEDGEVKGGSGNGGGMTLGDFIKVRKK